MRILISNMENPSIISQLPTPDLRRANVFNYYRPSFHGSLKIAHPADMFSLSRFYSFQLSIAKYPGSGSEIAFFSVVDVVVSSEIFRGPIICDKANQGLVPNCPLLPSSKPFNRCPSVTELIECTCYTTLELSFRIPESISTFPFPKYQFI